MKKLELRQIIREEIKNLVPPILFADFNYKTKSRSPQQRFARVASEAFHTFGAQDNLTIDDLYRSEMASFINDDPQMFYASKAMSAKVLQNLPDVVSITHNIDGDGERETFTLTKNGMGKFSIK